jgi:hypothetical protein
MSIPAANVRPKVFDAGSVVGTTTIDLTVSANAIFVVTSIMLALVGTGNDWSAVEIDGGIANLIGIPNPAITTAPLFREVTCDITLEQFSGVQITTNTVAGTTWWIIAGYTWAHGLEVS